MTYVQPIWANGPTPLDWAEQLGTEWAMEEIQNGASAPLPDPHASMPRAQIIVNVLGTRDYTDEEADEVVETWLRAYENYFNMALCAGCQ